MRRISAIALLGCAFTLPAAMPADGQVVQGVVIQAGDHRPVSGALVRLLTGDGRPLDIVLSDAAGRYAFTAPGAATYVVQVDHVRYATARSTPFSVPSPGAVTVNLTLTPHPARGTPAAPTGRGG
jgi:hypothetical protein